jgi:hypothetical protein
MTAKQVMDEIKLMTAEERQQVAEMLRKLEFSQDQRDAKDLTIEQVAHEIFTKHAPLMRKLAS